MKKLTVIHSFIASIIFSLLPYFSQAQMEFVENKGQWHDNVLFKGDFNAGAFFLENNGFTVVMHDAQDLERLSATVHGHAESGSAKPGTSQDTILNSFAYKMKFLGANGKLRPRPDKALPTHQNYFLGNDPARWAGDCKVYTAVTYADVYPNIDVRYYSDAGRLKYDFIVHPGGNPEYIAMRYDGPKELLIKDRKLIIKTPVGDVQELSPYSYQTLSTGKTTVDCKYVVKGNVVTFKVAGYNPKETLVIDPSIIFSTFTGSTTDNWGYTATPGPDGSFYAGGISFGTGYKVSPGAFQTTFSGGSDIEQIGGYDIAIFKFSPNGSNRLYATYLGGNGLEQPHSMVVDNAGNLIVAGRTTSTDYPTRAFAGNPGPGGGYDIIITKFNATGTALLGSVKVGGRGADGVNIRSKYPREVPASVSLRRNYGDDARSEVLLDGAGNISLVSCTSSTDFPVLNPVQATLGGAQDGVIMKFNGNLSVQLFSTYFGGSGDDACFVQNTNPLTGDLYVAGATTSSNLPGSTAGVMQPAFAGGLADGFITQLRGDGSAIIRTTYQGTAGIDLVYGLKFDRAGFPYIMGTTTGAWPVVNARFSQANSKQFIAKLRPDLSAYVYSTVFGTNSTVPNISPIAFLVDRCENVYVSGWGGGINVDQQYTTGTTAGLSEVNPLPGIPAADGKDFYFFVLERDANSQLFGSHFGQNGGLGDHVDGGTSRFDDNGVIYQAICANCSRGAVFPTTPGSWSPTNGSMACNQAAIKIEMNFAGVGAGVQASIAGVANDTAGCVPLTVDFRDTILKGKKYIWNFGDGSPIVNTTTATISHTFNNVGLYTVSLIAEDSTTCNVRDTAYVSIRVGNNKANLGFVSAKLPPCQSLAVQYTNTSTVVSGSFGPRSFVWDYGDGSPKVTTGFGPRTHTYAAPGTYNVTLTLYDPAFCNSPDTVMQQIRLNPLVKAQFETAPRGCVPYTAVFNNSSLAGTDFIWDFGDGTTSTAISPTHTYNNIGTFRVRLIAIDTSSCNKVDTSAIFAITVVPNPTAAFTWGPNPPRENTPVTFSNSSSGAASYVWEFGDGTSSTITNPVHQYDATGTYNATLIAINNDGCADTASLDVNVIVVPGLAVPNAFTPTQAGRNAVIKVEGFGIGKMMWRIYNRWGQLVFESTSKDLGWDGMFKGKLQAMDVYAYTLDVEFTNGEKVRQTGDITLFR